MTTTRALALSLPIAAALALGASPALAAGQVKAHLEGFQEVPSISTGAQGDFVARIGQGTIEYTLSYGGLEGNVLQAHIHFGQAGVNGGVSAFLCTNVGGPPGTPPCPASPAVVTGTIVAADVIGPGSQGISAGEIDELLDAIDAGATYVNVHTDLFPTGEIRGQVGRGMSR